MVKFKKSIAMLLAVALMISCFSLSVAASDAAVTHHEHSSFLYHATCNGRTQTWFYSCTYPGCSYGYTTTNTCPAGPHSGPCPALPV